MLYKRLTAVDVRFSYLSQLPWAFARADTVEGAIVDMDLLRARPLELQDLLTRARADRIGGDVDRRSQGLPASAALVQEVREINGMPLDESCGEGYHRDTHCEKKRAAASSSRHLKQHVRFRKCLGRVQHFIEVHGDRGRKVARWEWFNYKRILQTKKKLRWRRVHDGRVKVETRV